MTDSASRPAGPSVDGMPMLGYGTWQLRDPDACRRAVQTALDTGYRHVDTAQVYRNEAAVGEAIDRASVDRDDIFLATKLWTNNLAPGDVETAARESLDRLRTDYVDLLYVHWPAGDYDPQTTLPAFADLLEDGLVDRVGVSNFLPEQLREATDILDVAVFANQIEVHPLLPQFDLVESCQAMDVEVVAYSPLARTEAFDLPQVQTVAEKHDATPAQVCLAWLRERGITAIPKAGSTPHIQENWQSLDLALDDEDMDTIASIDRRMRCVDPEFAPW